MRTSIRTRSGRSAAASVTARSPDVASPTDSKPGVDVDQPPGRHEERRLVVDDQHPDGAGRPTGQVRAGMARVATVHVLSPAMLPGPTRSGQPVSTSMLGGVTRRPGRVPTPGGERHPTGHERT